jgi:divalent metal cation (Fe/Co/Zn/Cd) transporter
VHDVSVQDLNGQLHVEQHLELDEQLSMKQAHDEVTRLETEMRSEIPEIATILTHIESEPATIETGEEIVREPELEQRLKNIVKEFPEVMDVHEFQFKKVRARLYVSCHCTLAGRYAAFAGARRADVARDPLQTRRAGIVSRADSSRAGDR